MAFGSIQHPFVTKCLANEEQCMELKNGNIIDMQYYVGFQVYRIVI